MNKQQAEAIKTLTAAKALLEGRRRWIKGDEEDVVYAKDDTPLYYQYCSIGAIRKADGPGEGPATSLLAKAIKLMFPRRLAKVRSMGWLTISEPDDEIIMSFNDYKPTKKRDVLQAFDKAIELAQKD